MSGEVGRAARVVRVAVRVVMEDGMVVGVVRVAVAVRMAEEAVMVVTEAVADTMAERVERVAQEAVMAEWEGARADARVVMAVMVVMAERVVGLVV